MKIVLVSTFVPFVNGGARFIVEWLEDKLRERGHEVERFYLPFIDDPDALTDQISAFRLIDLTDAGDLLIAFRPPAYVIRHPNKVLWFIHHIRVFYDLWGHEYAPPATPANLQVRSALHRLDTIAISEARKIFTNSRRVSERLMQFNGIPSQPLYPPLPDPGVFRMDGYNDEIVVINRIEPHKRQMLFVEAMQHVKTPVRLRLCGTGIGQEYSGAIRAKIEAANLQERVVFDEGWISEDKKIDLLSKALAVGYAPFDEDGIGYPCNEAAHSRKAVITTTDAGGTTEFVENGVNGIVTSPTPEAIAAAMDTLYRDRKMARSLGEAGEARLDELRSNWDHIIAELTS